MNIQYNTITAKMSKDTTLFYTTSFSISIRLLSKELQQPIFDIYGFVRFADEIVDSFLEYPQQTLLDNFITETFTAINQKISMNPILHRFQHVVNTYKIDHELIRVFFKSMQMDLEITIHNKDSYDKYIHGSAEVVGLMCLQVFTLNQNEYFESIKSYAKKMGSALQKVNFLRDLQADYTSLARSYFPNIDLDNFKDEDKKKIEQEISEEFLTIKKAIETLPKSFKYSIYIIYLYYFELFKKITKTPAKKIMNTRIRVNNSKKFFMYCSVLLRKYIGL